METTHALKLIDRKRMEASGILEVIGFDEKQVELAGTDFQLLIAGDNLKIEKFSIETKDVIVTGEIGSLFYSSQQQQSASRGIFSRLFS